MAEIVIKNAVKKVNNNTIEVLSSAVGKEINRYSRIINSTLILRNVSGANFEVRLQNQSGEIIDYISEVVGGKIYLNITAEVGDIIKNSDEQVVIWFGGSFNGSAATDAELKVEYIPERIMHDGNAYFDVSAGRAGSGKINLATGGLNFVHSDSVASGISHIYNSWQAGKTAAHFDFAGAEKIIGEYGCGKGWKLNLHQYLVKHKGTSTQDLYTYIDDNGNYHELTERFYYKANGTKHYVKKETVNIGFDGKLTFVDNSSKTHEIKTELKTTSGLTLQTDLNGFAGVKKLELRSEERAQLEEEIESIERSKSDCLFAIEEYRKAESATYKFLMRQQERIEDESAELERRNVDAHNLTEGLMDTLISKKAELEHYVKKGDDGRYLNHPGYNYESKMDAAVNASEVVQNAQIRGTEENPGSELKLDAGTYGEGATHKINDGPSKSEMQTQKDASDALTAAQKELSRTVDLLQQTIGEISNRMEVINRDESKIVHSKHVFLQQLQTEFRTAKREYGNAEEVRQSERNDELYKRTIIDLEKAEKLLELRKFELNQVIEQEPVRYLTDKSGTIIGFNEVGALVAVADAYENVVYFYYEDNKLIGISDTDNNATKFEYNDDGFLERIVDADEKVIRFDYSESGNLVRATYPDETISEYDYNEFDQMQSAVNPAGYGIKLSYDHQKVVKAEEFTRTFEITEEGWRGLDGEETILITDIEYVGLSTTLTDRLKNSNTYIFDSFGKPVTVYEGAFFDPEETTKSLSIDYSGTKQSFSIEDKIKQKNWIPSGNRQGSLAGTKTSASKTEYVIYDINIPETHSFIAEGATDFVLSAWARADSAFIDSERKTDYSYSKIDSENAASDILKSQRKYELRAELTYDDGKETVFNASFDWLNTDWQYLAVPVTINEEDEVGDRIAARFPFVLGGENRKLTKLKVIVDYGYNVNNLQFECMTLRQGSWTYREFDADGKVSYSEDSTNGTQTRYFYDENDKVVKTVVTDRQHREYINTSEYNKKNQIVRSTDFNGLCEEIVYDDKGQAVKTITYNIADPTSKFYSESVRDDKGKVIADKDITGEFNSAEYGFDHKGAVNVITDAKGGKTAFGYHNDELTSISASCDGEENINTLKSMLGFTTKVSSGGTDYNFTYDEWGRQKEVLIAGENYSTVDYVDDKTTKITLATGEAFTEYADGKDDETVQVEIFNGEKFDCKVSKTLYAPAGEINAIEQTINYYDDESGLIVCSVDKSGEKLYTTEYDYDDNGRLVCKVEDGAGELEHDLEYDKNGGILHSRYEINGVVQNYTYGYDNALDNRQVNIELPSKAEQVLQYDGLGRLTSVLLDDNFAKDIYYLKSGDHATKLINSVWYGVNGKRDKNVRYTYDKKGNITSVRESGREVARYTYDSLDRLIREDNAVFKEVINGQLVTGKTETFEYDRSGNILAKTRYSYTTSETLGSGTRIEYGYNSSGWRDQLTSYNGETIAYDETVDPSAKLGNPTTYRGQPMQWAKGKNLASYSGHTFDYNVAGIRTTKTVGDIETTYYLDGTKIIAEEKRYKSSNNLIDALYYHYGFDGVTGFERKTSLDQPGTIYVYGKNVQGDIKHIYTKAGQLVVEYIYDAWGNHSVCAAVGYEELAERNPLRYRAYYYDTETGWYLLSTRYYDPEIGRFINADDVSYLDPETIGGLNLYSYCLNNPVSLTDSTGCSPFWDKVGNFFVNVGWFIGGVALTVVGAVATIITAPLLLIPGAASIPLFTLNMTMYGAMLTASPFSSSVRRDLDLIGWNPFNSDESAVLASQNISFYKGTFVARYGNAATTRGGGFSFGIIGIGRGETRLSTVSHEYGHHKQQRLLGLALFTAIVAIPSLISASRNTGAVHANKWYERWATNWGNGGWIWW